MPRRPKSKASTGPEAVVRRKAWRMDRTSLATPVLLEIGVDHGVWKGHCIDLKTMQCKSGDIVKIVPAPGADPEMEASIEKSFYEQGAATVKVMPTQDEMKVTVEGESFDFSDSGTADTRTLRQVALDRAARVRNVHDAPALETLINWAMDQAEAS